MQKIDNIIRSCIREYKIQNGIAKVPKKVAKSGLDKLPVKVKDLTLSVPKLEAPKFAPGLAKISAGSSRNLDDALPRTLTPDTNDHSNLVLGGICKTPKSFLQKWNEPAYNFELGGYDAEDSMPKLPDFDTKYISEKLRLDMPLGISENDTPSD